MKKFNFEEIKIPNDEYLHFLEMAKNGNAMAQIVNQIFGKK